jgi:hypothetical protein
MMARITSVLNLGLLFTMGVSAQAQNSLQITNPAPGTVVNPGQTVVVNVLASGGPFTSVSVLPTFDVNNDILLLTAPPYQFSFTVPVGSRPGLAAITAMGSTAAGEIDSLPVTIAIERSDSPQSITTDSSQLELRIGDQMTISVAGTYEDGSIVDLSHSTQTKYEPVIAGVVSVTADGFVTALAPGSTTIVVRHRDRQRTVKVTVIRDAN